MLVYRSVIFGGWKINVSECNVYIWNRDELGGGCYSKGGRFFFGTKTAGFMKRRAMNSYGLQRQGNRLSGSTENGPKPKRKESSSKNQEFQGRTVSFRKGKFLVISSAKHHFGCSNSMLSTFSFKVTFLLGPYMFQLPVPLTSSSYFFWGVQDW